MLVLVHVKKMRGELLRNNNSISFERNNLDELIEEVEDLLAWVEKVLAEQADRTCGWWISRGNNSVSCQNVTWIRQLSKNKVLAEQVELKLDIEEKWSLYWQSNELL